MRCVIHFVGSTSTTHRRVLFFGMKIVLEDPTASTQSAEPGSLFRVPVQFKIKNKNPSRHWFYLNLLLDSSDAIELNFESSYPIYRGSLPVALPLSKQSVQGYDPLLSVDPISDLSISIEYLDAIQVDYSAVKIPSRFVYNFYIDTSKFLMYDGRQILILNHSFDQPTKKSRYWLDISFELPTGEEMIDACKSHDGIYVLTSDKQQSTMLHFFGKDGQSRSPVVWPMRSTDGLIFELFGKIEVQLIVLNGPGSYELHTSNFDNFQVADEATFSRVEYISDRIVPQRISWASRRQPYYLIDTKAAKNYVVYEMMLFSFESPDPPMRSYNIPITSSFFKTCGYSKYIVVIQGVEVFGIDRDYGVTNKRRYFPVSEGNATKIISTHCDPNNPLLTVLFREVAGNRTYSRFVILRVEESGDFGLRRVHSRRLLASPVSDDAVIKTQTDYIGRTGILTIFDQGTIQEFAFQLAAPRVEVRSLSQDSQQFSFKAVNGESLKSETQNTIVRIVDQSFAASIEYTDKQDSDRSDETYDIERLAIVDGFYRSAQLSADYSALGVKSFTGRSTKLETIHLSMNVDEIIMERHTVFGWNNTHIVVYQNGKLNMINEEPQVTSANFVSEDTPTGLTQYIVGVTHDTISTKSLLLFRWRDP